MTTWKRTNNDEAGFSLVELLTVLGIIAVLSAIVFPVFFHVRENGRKTVCASNLRQIGQAFAQYVSDYDGVFPGAVRGTTNGSNRSMQGDMWTLCLRPYTGGQALFCPDRSLPGRFARLAASGYPDAPSAMTGYAMNYRVAEEIPLTKKTNGAARIDGKAETLFSHPSLTLLAFDARTGVATTNYPDVYPWRKWPPIYRDKWNGLNPKIWMLANYVKDIRAQSGGATRHNGGANYLLADGHVKWLRPEEISPGPTCDGVRPGFGL